MQRFFQTLFNLFILMSVSQTVQAKMYCNDDTPLCIEDTIKNYKIDVYAINKAYRSITGTMNITSENVTTKVRFPLEFHLKGKQKKHLFTAIIKYNKKWSFYYTYNYVECNTKAIHDTHYLYRLPYPKGRAYDIAQSCNGKVSHFGKQQYAMDFVMPVGTPLHAAREGIVIYVKEDSKKGGPSKEFYNDANYIAIEHPDGTYAEYVHLKYKGAVVKPGQKVKQGDLIGYSGNTGYTHGPHLHFAVFVSSNGKDYYSVPTTFDALEGHKQCPAPHTYMTAH